MKNKIQTKSAYKWKNCLVLFIFWIYFLIFNHIHSFVFINKSILKKHVLKHAESVLKHCKYKYY